MAIFSLCESKHCWISDLEKVPAQEFPYWIAYFQIRERQRKVEQRRAEIEAKSHKGRK